MKGQSAIEYLITYGWMLLVVAIAGGAIFSMTNVSTESVSGFQGQNVIVQDFGINSYGGLELLLLRADPQVDNVSNLSIEGTEIPVNVDFSSGNNDDIVHPFVIEASGTNNLDLSLVYNQGPLQNIISSGSLTGGYATDVPENLVGFWPLKEKYFEEPVVYDITENRNDGQISNLETIEDGRGGTQFSEEPVVVDHDESLNLGSEGTISLFTRGVELEKSFFQSFEPITDCGAGEEGLQSITDEGNYYLANDIDCSGEDFDNLAQVFDGSLDGQENTITGLDVDPALFGEIGAEGIVENLVIRDSTSTGANPSGLLSATNQNLIRNIEIINSGHSGGNYNVGLVTGVNFGSIQNVRARESETGAGNDNVGGLIGRNRVGGIVELAYFRGEVETSQIGGGEDEDRENTGGVVGRNDGEVSSIYAEANVTGYDKVGALIGYQDNDFEIGYWDEESSELDYVEGEGGAVGDQDDSDFDTVEGLTTEEMKNEENMPFFDFESNWEFVENENDGYPVTRSLDMTLIGKGQDLRIEGESTGDEWSNHVVAFNETHVSFYENGVLVEEPFDFSLDVDNNENVVIGEDANAVLSDVMMFDREMTQSEVQEHYERWGR